ncbi:hypothetical protein SAMD00019534_126170, partial [Acytostelium subglobosum LB1]|uniref:hypothetical protein n=1 Tax=Acytostelium subglobosum LB1 TaxID=1410327 RepID=UPI0006449B46
MDSSTTTTITPDISINNVSPPTFSPPNNNIIISNISNNGGGSSNGSLIKNKSPRNYEKSPRPKADTSQNGDFLLSIDRVQQGLDRRTSLMIKNLPNRLTQANLADLINDQFANTYDFLYLPMDPVQKGNLGYAFINFTDYQTIIPFYSKFYNRTWEVYQCTKKGDLTYARIQGKANMMQMLKPQQLNETDKTRPVSKEEQSQQQPTTPVTPISSVSFSTSLQQQQQQQRQSRHSTLSSSALTSNQQQQQQQQERTSSP